jgi:hypothetical protein
LRASRDPPDPDVEEQWADEAEHRWREIESGEVQTIPWEEVRAKLFRRGSNASSFIRKRTKRSLSKRLGIESEAR